jgi:hypothetical protein
VAELIGSKGKNKQMQEGIFDEEAGKSEDKQKRIQCD